MSDLEKFTNLFNEVGIDVEPSPYSHEGFNGQMLHIERHLKVDGYMGFYAEFVFDTDGKFIQLILAE